MTDNPHFGEIGEHSTLDAVHDKLKLPSAGISDKDIDGIVAHMRHERAVYDAKEAKKTARRVAKEEGE